MDLSFAEHLVESAQRLLGACKYNQSADGPVEPVYDTEKDVARFLVFLLDIILHNVRERSIARFVFLDDFSAFFVYDDNMVVFVNDCHDVFQTLMFDCHYMFMPPSTWIT